jgi:hypothetical protein
LNYARKQQREHEEIIPHTNLSENITLEASTNVVLQDINLKQSAKLLKLRSPGNEMIQDASLEVGILALCVPSRWV